MRRACSETHDHITFKRVASITYNTLICVVFTEWLELETLGPIVDDGPSVDFGRFSRLGRPQRHFSRDDDAMRVSNLRQVDEVFLELRNRVEVFDHLELSRRKHGIGRLSRCVLGQEPRRFGRAILEHWRVFVQRRAVNCRV